MRALVGNPRAVVAVQRALASGSPPHAWLFAGPEGVGKASLALRQAQSVNGEKDGQAKLMRRRETYEDITRADVWPLE